MEETGVTYEINIEKVNQSRISQVDFKNIPFGRIFSDHMFTVDYIEGGWQNPKICPYQKIALNPSVAVLHYGQAIFEGMKAYKNHQGNPQLFRPYKNHQRFNISARRMAMPEVPEEIFMGGVKELVNLDQAWIPTERGSALYIRPFMFSTEEYIGIKPSDKFKFMVFTCAVGAYYPDPIKVLVAEKYVRAFPGGVGFAKAAGNYAATLMPIQEANAQGYTQLLWMDGIEYKYIQESGTMNMFFVIDGVVVTPKLNDAILDGITRDSVIQLLKDKNIPVEEREVSIDEIVKSSQAGKLQEAFGTGTAVTIGPIKAIGYQGKDIIIPPSNENSITTRLKQELGDIKTSSIADPHNWVVKI